MNIPHSVLTRDVNVHTISGTRTRMSTEDTSKTYGRNIPNAHWDHRNNTYLIWKTIQSTYTYTEPLHNIQLQNNNHIYNVANCFTKQFTNTVRHATHKTNRSINRTTQKIQGYNITLTTTEVQGEIKQSNNNKSHGPDKLKIFQEHV